MIPVQETDKNKTMEHETKAFIEKEMTQRPSENSQLAVTERSIKSVKQMNNNMKVKTEEKGKK